MKNFPVLCNITEKPIQRHLLCFLLRFLRKCYIKLLLNTVFSCISAALFGWYFCTNFCICSHFIHLHRVVPSESFLCLLFFLLCRLNLFHNLLLLGIITHSSEDRQSESQRERGRERENLHCQTLVCLSS